MRLFPEGQGGPVQRQLVGLSIDGLAHDYLKMKVMREKKPWNLSVPWG